MKYRFKMFAASAATMAVAMVGFCLTPPSASAQDTDKPRCDGCSVDGKTTPRTPDGHPDFSGFYNLNAIYHGDPKEEKPGQHVVSRNADGSVFFDYGGANQGAGNPEAEGKAADGPKRQGRDITCGDCNNPPYKPEYMAKVKAIADAESGNASPLDPQYDCKPYGVPRGSLRGAGGYAMQIVQNKDVIAFLYEDRPGPYFRIVYMDGRPHPDDLDASYYGNSIGHWDGDTLVVDVTGLNDETWLGSGTVGPKYAMMHSDQMHVIERWTRTGDTVTYQATVEDPVMFTKPWVMTPRTTQIAAPGDYIRPQMCIIFDKEHLVKKDSTPYTPSEDAAKPGASASSAESIPMMAGTWNITIHSTVDGILTQQWTLKQDGDKVSGTAKTKNGDAPLEGMLEGAVFKGMIADGDAKYELNGTVVNNDLDGTIRMGKNEFLMAAKRAQ